MIDIEHQNKKTITVWLCGDEDDENHEYCYSIAVDLNDDTVPFMITNNQDNCILGNWISLDALLEIKKMVDRAIRIHEKEGVS